MAQKNENAVVAAPAPQRVSILSKMANRFSVEPAVLQKTLADTVFKGATNEQTVALLVVADQYGLNPFTKEIYAFPAKGGGIVPVVGIDGWLRIINEHPQFDGMDFDQDDDSCTCRIYRKDRSHPVVITEYHDECKRDTDPWRTAPKRMLRHKAIIQCGRVAFSFAGIHDEDEATTIVDAEVVGTVGKPAVKTPQRRVSADPSPAEQVRIVATDLGMSPEKLAEILDAEFSVTDLEKITPDVVPVICEVLQNIASTK